MPLWLPGYGLVKAKFLKRDPYLEGAVADYKIPRSPENSGVTQNDRNTLLFRPKMRLKTEFEGEIFHHSLNLQQPLLGEI